MIWGRRPTFETLAQEALELRKTKSRKTYLSAKFQLSRLIKHFGSFRIDRISERDWNAYIISEQEKRPGRRMYDDRKYMRIVLLMALRRGSVQKKIMLAIPDPPSDAGRDLSRAEISRLIAAASPELKFQIEIAVKMGLRLREMLRLRWDQIDWEKAAIKLSSADTKTRRPRELPINPDLYERFKLRHERAKSRYVFPAPGNPNRAQTDNKTAWRRVKRLTGVSARWHDLRHTCASWMLRRGVQLHVARQLLGMSEKILMRIYAHTNEDDMKRAARLMSDTARVRPRRARTG